MNTSIAGSIESCKQGTDSPLVQAAQDAGLSYVTLKVCVTPDAQGNSDLSELLDALREARTEVLLGVGEEPLDEEDEVFYERLDTLYHNLTTQALHQMAVQHPVA